MSETETAHFSRSSVISPKGVHSNTIRPGYPPGPLADDNGIENTVSFDQVPEMGTSNLRSNQIAVASLSGFIESQMFQGIFNAEEFSDLICFLMTCKNDPGDQRSSCSVWFWMQRLSTNMTIYRGMRRNNNEKGSRKCQVQEYMHTKETVCTSFNRFANSSSVLGGRYWLEIRFLCFLICRDTLSCASPSSNRLFLSATSIGFSFLDDTRKGE